MLYSCSTEEDLIADVCFTQLTKSEVCVQRSQIALRRISERCLLIAGCLWHQLCIAVVPVYHNSNLLQFGGVAEQDPRGHHRPRGIPCALEPGKSCQHLGGAGRGYNLCPGEVCTWDKVIASSKTTSFPNEEYIVPTRANTILVRE